MVARLSGWWKRREDSGPQLNEAASGAPRPLWWEIAAYATVIATAAGMRLWDLGSRALHHDESLHAYYAWRLSEGHGFKHDPMMHGPLQFESSAALLTLFGDNDYSSRVLYALAGTALVAMPFFFRARLGRLGALFVSVLLAFSPAMLYFSRFARNDILIALLALGIVTAFWRYLDGGKNRYLYITSGLLALAIATKETAYILIAVLGLYVVLRFVTEVWARARGITGADDTPPPTFLKRLSNAAKSTFQRSVGPSGVSRSGSFLVLLVTLTLPQWAAAVGVLQDTPLLSWMNVVLTNPEGTWPVGAPAGGGLVIAGLVVAGFLAISGYLGYRWNWSVWWRCAIIFYVVWVLLYSTFFTNPVGIGSGIWQSLGYWLVQQGEARGGQPWYYYLVITPIYEFLPLLLGAVASVYYLRRRDAFAHFLVYWAALSFVLYTIASEKMPWLLVNISLPLIVLSGRFLADMVKTIHWSRLVRGGGLLALPGVPLFLVLLWQLALFEGESTGVGNVLIPLAMAGTLLGLAGLGVYLARRSGARSFTAFATLATAVVLLVLTVRTGAIAAYENGDTPVEMIIYTQTSPDVPRLMEAIEQGAGATGEDTGLGVYVDQKSGFSWPWAWYLRDYTSAGYFSYGDGASPEVPGQPVVLIHGQNRADAEQALGDLYTKGERIRHRWWFPEETYRNVTPGKFLRGLVDRGAWRTVADYFLHRKGVEDRLGSEDSYVFFEQQFPQSFEAEE